jgi:hypothetical protein
VPFRESLCSPPSAYEGFVARCPWRVIHRFWPSNTVAAMQPNGLYLVDQKDILASPRRYLPHRQFPLSMGTGTFPEPLSVSPPPFRSCSSHIARAKREKGNSGVSRRSLLGLVATTVLLGLAYMYVGEPATSYRRDKGRPTSSSILRNSELTP